MKISITTDTCCWNRFETYRFRRDFTPIKFGEYFKSGYSYFINRNRKEDIQQFFYQRRTLGVYGKLVINDTAALFPSNIRQSCSDPCPPGHATVIFIIYPYDASNRMALIRALLTLFADQTKWYLLLEMRPLRFDRNTERYLNMHQMRTR